MENREYGAVALGELSQRLRHQQKDAAFQYRKEPVVVWYARDLAEVGRVQLSLDSENRNISISQARALVVLGETVSRWHGVLSGEETFSLESYVYGLNQGLGKYAQVGGRFTSPSEALCAVRIPDAYTDWLQQEAQKDSTFASLLSKFPYSLPFSAQCYLQTRGIMDSSISRIIRGMSMPYGRVARCLIGEYPDAPAEFDKVVDEELKKTLRLALGGEVKTPGTHNLSPFDLRDNNERVMYEAQKFGGEQLKEWRVVEPRVHFDNQTGFPIPTDRMILKVSN